MISTAIAPNTDPRLEPLVEQLLAFRGVRVLAAFSLKTRPNIATINIDYGRSLLELAQFADRLAGKWGEAEVSIQWPGENNKPFIEIEVVNAFVDEAIKALSCIQREWS
jgi:hypothetical protein